MAEPFTYDARPRTFADESLVAPIVVYVLYMVALPTVGLSSVVGLIMAYALKGEAGPAAHSHYVFQIRTFWLHLLAFPIGLLLLIVGIPLSFVLVGLPLVILGGLLMAGGHIWYLVRCVFGLVIAAQGEGYPRPRTLLA